MRETAILLLLLCSLQLIRGKCLIIMKTHVECRSGIENLDEVVRNVTSETGNEVDLLFIKKTNIPILDFKEVSDVKHVVLIDCTIGRIKKDAFSALTKLNKLILRHTVIEDLEDVFDDLKSLEMFMFSENVVKGGVSMDNIVRGLSEHVPNLKRLQLNNNGFENMDWLGHFDNLLSLHLAKNNIKTLPSALSEKLPKLNYFDMQYNQLYSVGDDTFKNMNELRALNLADNNITEISSAAFADLQAVAELTLKNNSISSITVDTFSGLKNLTILNLEQNIIETIPDFIFQHNSKLENVLLKDNTISSVGIKAFRNNEKLVNLDLSNNLIENLSPNTFDGLLGLHFLDLTRNNLEILETGLFKGIPNLKALKIAYNRIKKVQNGAFKDIAYLHNLDLSYNEIEEWNPKAFDNVNKLGKFNLEGNKIKIIQANAFHGLNVDVIDLKHNEIIQINEDGFRGLVFLKYLGLSGNNIKEYRGKALDQLTELKCVDIMDNKGQHVMILNQLPKYELFFSGYSSSEQEKEQTTL